MYHRPFPSAAQRRPSPGAALPAPPAIGRYALPEAGSAAAAVLRFVGQAYVLVTAALLLVQAVRCIWPAGCLVLFGVASVALLAGAGLKWLWGSRAGEFPVLTAATILGGVVWVLGSLGSAMSLAGVFLIGFGVVLLMQLAAVARWADAVTMWQDWRATLALGSGALLLLLLLVGLVPPSLTAFRLLFPVVMVANSSFVIAASVVYANYVLANPTHPQEVIAAPAARWRREVWWPIIGLGICCGMIIGLMIGLPDPTPESATEVRRAVVLAVSSDDAAPPWERLVVPGFFVSCCAVVVGSLLMYGRVCWRAFMVWMLYGAGSEPVPGIYRPGGCIGSARARQALFAALVVTNVILFRVVFSLDMVLWAVLGGPDHPPESGLELRISLAAFAATFVLPLLLPAYLLLTLSGPALRKIHNQVEATPPKDLYPDEPHTATEPQRLFPKH